MISRHLHGPKDLQNNDAKIVSPSTNQQSKNRMKKIMGKIRSCMFLPISTYMYDIGYVRVGARNNRKTTVKLQKTATSDSINMIRKFSYYNLFFTTKRHEFSWKLILFLLDFKNYSYCFIWRGKL